MALEGGAKCVKILMFVFNFIFFLGGIGLLGVGIYVHLKIGDYVDLSSVKYVTGSIIIMTVGAIIAIIAFFGCCGAMKESRCLLGIFFALMLLVFGLEVTGTALGYVFRGKVQTQLEQDLNNTLSQYGMDDQKGVTDAFDLLQQEEECCGVYNYKDWQRSYFTQGNHSFVPDSCCKKESSGCGNISEGTSSIYTEGCYKKTLELLRNNLLIIGAIGVAVAVVQLLSMIFAMVLICNIKDQNTYA
ncbi:tetraspanin-4-like [Montipora foliosa]|uniref:tetraspanin-4-like n=1 Tax=Montipora foliosa TaxID=591990 RepID=UPI0035F1E0B2